MSSEEILQVQYNTSKRINYSKLRQRLILEKIKQNASGKDYAMSIINNGKNVFNTFYHKGKNIYVDKLPTIKVNSNKTSSNINNIKAYIAAIENCTVEDITYCSVNASNDIPYYLGYLIQDYEHIPQDVLITDNLFSYYLDNNYTYTFSPITNEITFNKPNTVSITYAYDSTTSSTIESYTYTDDDGYEVEAVRFKDLDSDEWINPNDGIIEPKTRIEFVNKANSNDKRHITFMSGTDVNPFRYTPYLPDASEYNFNEVCWVDYTVNNIDKRIVFSIPDQNTITYNNKTYKLFNDPNAVSKTIHTYPIITLRFRTTDIQAIKELSDELNQGKLIDLDNIKNNYPNRVVDGATGFFTVDRYKTTKSLLKTLGYDLQDITDSYRYSSDKNDKEKVLNENLDKVFSVFLLFGIGNLKDIQETVEGKTVSVDGEDKVIKGDSNAEVLVKYLYKMIEYFMVNSSTGSIYLYIREIVHRTVYNFTNITKTVVIKNNNNKLPKPKYSISFEGDWYPTYIYRDENDSTVVLKKDEGNKETVYKFQLYTETNIYMEIENGNGIHGKKVWSEYEPIIPLIKEVVDTLSIQDKCRLLTYCTQLEMQIAYRQKLKWYQTVEFQTTMIVLGMGIAWIAPYFGGTLVPFIYIASQFVNVAIKDPILKASLQIVLIAIELYSIDWTTFLESINIFEAVHLVSIPIKIADILTQAYYGIQNNKLQKQINTFTTTAEDKLDYLESLDTTKLNNSYLIIEGTTLFGQDISPVLSGSSIIFLNNCYKNYNILYQKGIEYFYDNLYELRYDYSEN